MLFNVVERVVSYLLGIVLVQCTSSREWINSFDTDSNFKDIINFYKTRLKRNL